jgi:translocation and assembly module TamB
VSESIPKTSTPPANVRKPRRRLLRFGIAAIILSALLLLALLWAGSSSCENFVRRRIIAKIQDATGGRVELASLHWHLFDLDAELSGLLIHGREAANEAPYVQVDRAHVRISILQIFSPRIQLRDLEVTHPAVHLIVYPDGTTNQPQPLRVTSDKPTLDTLFDLRAGHIAVEQGFLDYENRAASFDVQNRHLPLDFDASDISTVLTYVPSKAKTPETYTIELGAQNFHIARGTPAKPVSIPVDGYFQATIDLQHNAASLRSLRITARSKGVPDRTLTVSGALTNFARAYWSAKAQGDFDMRLLDPITGYPNAPEGIAHLNLDAGGHDGLFRIDGPIHVDGGAYVGTGVNARGILLDARVHADPQELLISSVIARLRQGGQMEGTVALTHWIVPIASTAQLEPAPPPTKKSFFFHKRPQAVQPKNVAPADVITIPVNGKVTAQFKNVAIDTILDFVSQPPYQRLGLDGRLNGPATATWNNGDVNTLAVVAKFGVNAPATSLAGEAPTSGVVDATYTQRDGSVDLRSLDLTLPSSHISAQGHLGAYPLTSSTTLAVAVHSHHLDEFSRLLSDLGLNRQGRTGSAALPATLSGDADFQGTWTGSLVDPHLTGNLKASDFAVELPPTPSNGAPRFVHLDSVDATGTYSAARITIDHADLVHGSATVALGGSLIAATPTSKIPRPSFDLNSQLHIHVTGNHVSAQELESLTGENLPLSGELNAQLQADGPIATLDGSGWIELNHGNVYGEPIARVRAEGKVAGRILQLSSVSVDHPAGKLSASGSYDLRTRQFQINAQGSAIDLSHVQSLQNAGLATTGQLAFTITGSGTPEDPRLLAKGLLTGITFGGEPLGGVQINAHTANHALLYDVATQFDTASLTAHGETALNKDYTTQARLDFANFNIAAPLKLAHIPGLTGESSLAGTVTIQGPLAHTDQLHGEAQIQDLELTLVGVHLRSQGPLHAALAGERITLDPVHITGEQTDLHAQGSLDLKNNRRLDLASNGSINLKLAETLDPDLTASGTTTFQVEAHGTLQDPGLRGRVDFQNASLALEDLPNSLSQLKGTLEFNQNRLEVRSLTATTGGGQLSVSGYLAYQHGIFADLSVSGKGIRIRYPAGVSSLADADFHLLGPQNNLLLSGGVMITRFTVSPDLDIAGLATQAGKIQPVVSPDAPSNHVRLDVHIQSSPQLNFQNAYAKLAGDVDLTLRGTLATPSLLGRISITEGSATIAGTRYELQRGDITFTNPVRIEPEIDLNATARVEDYDITLGLHGSPEKMNVSYRSDPPLPEADVVALLALGRTQNEQQLYGQQQEQVAANPTTEALLGGALNATVSSRVQKLFGAGSVKVDPNYLGVLGNSTTRITVEEQLGKNLTLTYATDVNTTAQQLLQAEIAINRHVSLLVARDESGVFSMVVKATRRYR